MLGWLTGNDSKATKVKTGRLVTPELAAKQEKLAALRAEQSRQTLRVNAQGKVYLKAHELRERIAKITRRNKARSILVIPFHQSPDSPLVEILLDANSNALPTYADDINDGVKRLEQGSYDMVYVVVNMAQYGHGPCFFSAENEKDTELREQHSSFMKYVDEVKPLAGDAEIVVVCGASQHVCPITEKLVEHYKETT